MEVNHNNNKTLHAYDGNEEMRFYKKVKSWNASSK
jgi:hypothetical protein